MGSSLGNVKTNTEPLINSNEKESEWKRVRNKQNQVNIDVIQVSNIALAIKHKEHIVNVELIVLSCNNLPQTKTFEEINSMVVIFKISQNEQIQIGRTEIIVNDLNPRYLSTFIVASSSDKQEEIQFRIYNFNNASSEELRDQVLIGTVRASLDEMIYTEFNPFPVMLADINHKDKTMLKVHCSDYDGGNIKYEIDLVAANFLGKVELYYVIQVVRDGQLIPIAKSNIIQFRKRTDFDMVKVAVSKFPGEEAARLRIRFYDVSKSEQEVGCTEQLTLLNLLSQQQKTAAPINQRVYKNGFVVGNIIINRWRKVNRDSFLTYIVNGARLHLILGIDFTNSNDKAAEPLHNQNDEKNLYIAAIREIVGMLQYFDYYNQIALYGFGAKLPPYYKCVGQCFALNGNYFNPLITGGVEQIIRYYKDNLARIKLHGPSKISEIINMAIQFAQAEYQSTNYYVLILLTDGQIDDFADTVDKIIEASSLPLSIVIVGLGDGDFTQIQKFDQDGQPLKSQKTGKICERDMIDFINFKEYLCQEKSSSTETNLARKTFAQIPSQFVDYMQRKGIKPNKEKKGLKAAKSEFISQKIKEYKKSNSDFQCIPQVQFLKEQKKRMRRQLLALGLGMQSQEELEKNLCIPMNNLNYFIEICSAQKPKQRQEKEEIITEIVTYQQEKKFEEYLEKNEEFINKRIQNQLLKREINQLSKRKRVLQKPVEVTKKETKKLKHPCLQCRENEISILHDSCGHLAVCEHCSTNICFICKEYSRELKNINDYQH